MSQIPNLYDYQEINLQELEKIRETNKIAFNFSEMGLGKSIVSLHIAKKYKHILVTSYPAVINLNWKLINQKYDLNFNLITINMLRGIKNSENNSPLPMAKTASLITGKPTGA